MLDDSWDSASSPDVKKKSSAPNRNQKFGSMDSKYNFPAPAATKRSSYKDDSYDNDILFSPTNSQGSPSGSPMDYKNRSYNFNDSPSKDANADYLANFVTESADLEDSILGGLLGGGKKAFSRPAVSKPRSPQSKLEPIDANSSDNSSYNNDYSSAHTPNKTQQATKISPRRASPPKSYKSSNYRSTSPSELNPIQSDDDSDFPISPAFGMKRHTSIEDIEGKATAASKRIEPVQSSFDTYTSSFASPGKKNRAQPSFDVTNDAGFLASLEREDELNSSIDIPVVKKFTDGLVRPKTSVGRDALPPASSASAASQVQRPATSDVSGRGAPVSGKMAEKDENKDKDNDDTAGLAFIPSFLEPGRQTRRRRQLDTSPGRQSFGGGGDSEGFGAGVGVASGGGGGGGGGMPKLHDLDLALGLGGPATAPKKTFVDPFSAVDTKMPKLEKQSSYNLHSDDSSSDDDLLNPNRYGRKDSFMITKPATGTNTAAAKTVGKEASTTFSASSAFPPSNQPAPPVTAPSRISTFTPAKPSVASAEPVPVPNLQSALGAHNKNAASLDMSDSFEDISALNQKPATEGVFSNASLASLPSISPVASFRTGASALPDPIMKKVKEPVSQFDDEDEVDDLDVSGIVRIDLEEDIMPRNNRSHKSPSTSDRPRSSSSRSPRSSLTENVVSETSARNTAVGTPRVTTSGLSSMGEANTVHLSIRTNSPAGMLTAAVNNFDATDAAQSRRNSASNQNYARSVSPVQSTKTTTLTFQEGLVRDRAGSNAPISSSIANNNRSNTGSHIPAEQSYSGFSGNRRSSDTAEPLANSPAPAEARSGSVTSALPVEPALPVHVPVDLAEHERQLRHQIEVLKVQLNHPQPASFQHSLIHTAAEEREHYRLLQDSNINYVQESIDQKRLIAHLESEISRLKDEANIKANRNHEEMIWLKEKYESEIKDIKIKNSIETEALERRQEDSLSSLRKLHAHELEAIKERYKSEEKFEQIAGQLRTTSGSIRFIEEQLQTRQRGVEAIREGQIDARERLLADMEEKARERAEIAEAEGYRLKGILSHMEHVVSSLREQGSEEKERLRQEHSRLQSRQSAFEAERVALQNRNMEELAYIKQRSKEVELELVKLTQEKQAQFEAIASAQSKFDAERAEFNAFAATSKRALELTETRLKEEDARVSRLRNEMLLEKNSLEDRRTAAMRDIEAAEELRTVLVRAQQENETEKEELRRISQSYKAASEELLQHERELQEQQEALEERELALREGFAQMKLAAGELTRREGSIKDSVQFLDRKRLAVERADRESMENRLVSAASFREWSIRQSSDNLPMPPPQSRFGNPAATDWEGRRGGEGGSPSAAEDVFSKYDVYGSHPTNPLSSQRGPQSARASADEHLFRSMRYMSGSAQHMSKSAEFDSGFGPRTANHSYFGGMDRNQNGAHHSPSEKENMYAQVLQSQQQTEKPWIEVFQGKLKQAFAQGTNGSSEGSGHLPVELRTAQMTLRQSRGQLSRVGAGSVHVQRLIDEESDFLNTLQTRKSQLN